MVAGASKIGTTQSADCEMVVVPEIEDISIDLLDEAFPSQGGNLFSVKPNKTGYRGVTKIKKKMKKPYVARIRCKGIRKFLGNYKSPREAAKAYDKAARILYGERATTNF